MISSILALVFLVSLFQAPIPAAEAKTATIPVTVGGQTIQVTPGQWVTVNTPGGSTSYNVRFVDGKPVAIEMSQYTKLVFGDAASAGGSSNAGANQTSGGANQTSSGANQTSSGANQSSSGANQAPATSVAEGASGNAAQTTTTTTPANSGNGGMTWNEFQKANSGKYTKAEMSEAWKNYKAGNGAGAQATSAGSSQSSSVTSQTPATSVAEGASGNAAQTTSTGANQTSGSAAQTSGGAAQASVADGSATTQTTSSGKTWDPAKHPRDPQTGRFISHEEAVARGLMDPADANISSNSNSSQTAQTSTEAGQSSGNAAQSSVETAQAGTAADAAQTSGGKDSKPSIGDKFKSGYETGKNLTNAGFQNVKDSLKSGFSAKNLLVTAGITVGVDLATQVMRGEQPNIKSALKTVCSAEFVGSVTGSVLGAAAGSFFVPFLSCIPVVGGALSALAPTFGSIVGSSVGAYTAGDLKNGRFSIKEAFKRIDWVGVTGQTIGSTVGAALGSCLGPVGTVLGGMVGGYFGNWAAHKIAGLFGKGNANLPTISTPVGTSGNGVSVAGTVTLGGGDVTSVTVSNETPVVVASEEDTKPSVTVTSDDEITAAYEEYTIHYTEYSKLIQSGKMEEALAVAEKMNAAKAKYDQLRSSEND